MHARQVRRRNWRACILLDMLVMAYLGNATLITYYTQDLHFSQDQIYSLTTTISLVVLLGTMPFGYLADMIGVKRLVVIGGTLRLIHSVVFACGGSYWQIWLSIVIQGLARGATSDLTSATMTFSLGYIKSLRAQELLYRRYQRQRTVMASGCTYAVTVLVGACLTWYGGVRLPVVVQPVIEAAYLVTACYVKQPMQPVGIRKQLPHKLVRLMFVDRRDIRAVICLTAVLESSMTLIAILIQPRLSMMDIPVWAYAGFYALWAMGVASVGYFVHRWMKEPDIRRELRIWTALVWLLSGTILGAGLTTGLGGVLLLLIGLSVNNACYKSLSRAFLRQALPADRQTHNAELAIASMASLLLIGVAAFFFGMLVAATSVGFGFVTIATLTVTSGLLALRALKKSL